MFFASGKFSGITGSPSGGDGAAGGYQEEEGRYVPGRLRRRDEPAGEGLFQEEEGCCFQSRRPWGERADRGKKVLEEAEDVCFRIEGGPSGCPRYRGLSRAEAAKRPCGCRGSADGKKFVVFHDGPP